MLFPAPVRLARVVRLIMPAVRHCQVICVSLEGGVRSCLLGIRLDEGEIPVEMVESRPKEWWAGRST